MMTCACKADAELPDILDYTNRERRTLRFCSTKLGLGLDFDSTRANPGCEFKISIQPKEAFLYLSGKNGYQEARWCCLMRGCSGGGCRHFTSAKVTEQVRKTVAGLSAYEAELPWHVIRSAGCRPLSVEAHAALISEIPEIDALPDHVTHALGDALWGLKMLMDLATENDVAWEKRTRERAVVKKLFEELPAGTLLIRDDGRVLGTMTDARGRTTHRSIDCQDVDGTSITRKDVRLDIRERFRVLTAETINRIPAHCMSMHTRLDLIAKAPDLDDRFAPLF